VRDGAGLWRLRGIEQKVHLHTGDITAAERLRDLVLAIQPSVVYHLAVHGAYPDQIDADRIILTDIFGTWNLLKACAEADYKVFVNTSSSSEYGAKLYAMRETDLPEPSSYYAVAKCAQTLVCQNMARADRRPVNTFRLFSVYGPYEAPSRLIPTIIRRCLEGKDLEMISLLPFLATLVTAVAIAFYIAFYFIVPNAPRGFMTLLVAILFLGSLQLFCLSILAEYLGRIFEEVKQRAAFIVRSVINDHQEARTAAVSGATAEVTGSNAQPVR
jgi:hypothetical protein